MSAAPVDDYRGDTETTGRLTVGVQATGTIEVANDRDWFAIDLVAGTTYVFRGLDAASGGGSIPDVWLSLYDSRGLFIDGSLGSDDIGFTPTVSGRYFIGVQGSSGSDRGTYTLITNASSIIDDYRGDTETTGRLTVGVQATGTIEVANDRDWFAIDLVAGTTYVFRGLDAASGGGSIPDVWLSLYDSRGLFIDGSLGSDDIGFTPTVSGRYFIGVQGSSGSDRGTYTIAASAPARELPIISINSAPVSEVEQNSGSRTSFIFAVTRTGDVGATSTVNWAVRGSGSTPADTEDFGGTLPSGTLIFAAGDRTQNISVQVTGDANFEADETFTITFSSPVNATLDTASATGIIRNDDRRVITGTDAGDILIGSMGDDQIGGFGGDDTLAGNGGDDILDGGAGDDTASYADAAAAVTVSLLRTGAQATGSSGADTLVGIENLTGSRFDDRLTGDAGANRLDGGAGNDTLLGSSGDDVLIGRAGRNLLDGGSGSDWALYDWAEAAVSVNLLRTTAQNTFGGSIDTLTGVENLVGTQFDDRLTGNIAANTLVGGAGNDTLLGSSGNDTLMGGAGDDFLDAGTGRDAVSYADAAAGVTVRLDTAAAQDTGGAGTDTLRGVEGLIGSRFADTLIGNSTHNRLDGGAGNDTLDGGLRNDTLLGGAGDDHLTGGSGNDRLIGGEGNDALRGGNGADIFVFESPTDPGTLASATDTIMDFARGADRIDLSGIDANTATADNDAFTALIRADAAFTAAGQLRLVNGVLFGNTDGDPEPEFAIRLPGVSELSLGDFIL